MTIKEPISVDPRQRLIQLEEEYDILNGDESPNGIMQRSVIRSKLKRLTHEEIHPNEAWTEINMPLQADGHPFKINDEVFQGIVQVPGCQAGTLLHMLELNRSVELDRMRENGRQLMVGPIVDRARAIQGER